LWRPGSSRGLGRERRWLERRKLGIDQESGTDQGHDQTVHLRFEPVHLRFEPVHLRFEPVHLRLKSIHSPLKSIEVGSQPSEARAARCDESGESNSQQRGEDFGFHESYSSGPL